MYTIENLESDFFGNENEIRDRILVYGFNKNKINEIRNYYDLATLLDVDSRLLKDVELSMYANSLQEFLNMD